MQNHTGQKQSSNSGKQAKSGLGKWTRTIIWGASALAFFIFTLVSHIISLPDIWTITGWALTALQTAVTVVEAIIKSRNKKWHDVPGWIKEKWSLLWSSGTPDFLPSILDNKEVYLTIIYHQHDNRLVGFFEAWLNYVDCKPNIILWNENDPVSLITQVAEASRHVLFVLSEPFANRLKNHVDWFEEMKELAKTPAPNENRPVGITVLVDGFVLEDSLMQQLHGFSLPSPSTTKNDIRKFFSMVYPAWQYAGNGRGKTADEILDEIVKITSSKRTSGALTLDPSITSIWTAPGLDTDENPEYQEYRNEEGGLCQQILDRFGNTKAPRVPQVIWGINGVGKTELALAYARRYGGSVHSVGRMYRYVLWVEASKKSFEEICNILFKFLYVSPSDQDMPDLSQKQKAIQSWFETTSERWLLVLDGYTPNTDLSELKHILPSPPTGDVLLTVHQLPEKIAAPRNAVLIPLKPMNDEEGAMLLLNFWKKPTTKLSRDNWKQRNGRDWETAQEIVREMGGLPVGIELTAKYLAARPLWTLQMYLEEYKKSSVGLFKRQPYDAENDDYDRFFRTFTELFQTVSEDSHGAGEILLLLALLSPDHPIPGDILEAIPRFGGPCPALDRALALLYHLSVIEKCDRCSDKMTMYKVNKLVQAIVRDGRYPNPNQAVSAEETRQRFLQGVTILNRVDIFRKRDASLYLPHIVACCKTIIAFEIFSKEAAQLFLNTSEYLHKFPHYEEKDWPGAEELMNSGLAMLDILQADDQTELPTPTYLNSRAEMHHDHFEHDKAEEYYLKALERSRNRGILTRPAAQEDAGISKGMGNGMVAREKGAEDRTHNTSLREDDQATILKNIARFYSELKKHDEATKRIEEALKLRDEQLESAKTANRYRAGQPLPTDVHNALLDRAICYDTAGVVFMRKGEFAEQHHQQITSYKRAEKCYLEALKDLKYLGSRSSFDEIQYQVCCERNLATLYTLWGKKKYGKAEKYFQSALRHAEKALNNPQDISIQNDLLLAQLTKYNNMAELYRVQDKKSEAEQQYKEAIALYGRHPDKIKSRKWQLVMLGVLYNFISFLRETRAIETEIDEQKEKFREIQRALRNAGSHRPEANYH